MVRSLRTSSPGQRRPRDSRRRTVARRSGVLAATALLLLLLWTTAVPAGAVITGGVGVQAREAPVVEAAPLQYHSGPVLHSTDAYVVYWDPHETYRGDWERLIDRYFQDVGSESKELGDIFAVTSQYLDGGGHSANQTTFRGSFKAQDPYPADAENCTAAHAVTCLSEEQVKTELFKVINSIAPPLPGSTGTPVYYLLTPPGVTVCTGSGAGTPETCSNSAQLETESNEIEVKKISGPAKTGICGYHSSLNSGAPGTVAFAVQPWVAGDAGFITSAPSQPLTTAKPTAAVLACQDNKELQEPNQLKGLNPFGDYAEGLADLIISDLSIEQANIVVDPFFSGWYQTTSKAEQSDVCQFSYGPPPQEPPTPDPHTNAGANSNETINGDPYYVQWTFNSSGATAGGGIGCWSGVALEPFFTAPNPIERGDIVGFNATESNITLDARPGSAPYESPVYSWNFGDGETATGVNAASEFHRYATGGEKTVTLSVRDGGGNVRTTTRTITVNPLPGASGAGSGSGAGSSAAGGSSPSGGGGSGVGGKTGSAPVATALVLSRSLRSVARGGLVVRYSVNQQVAGHFEVLLNRTLARRLGIGGAPAVGLPAGSPPALVIGKAVLVTTRGGRGTMKIALSKRTDTRLLRLRKVSLTLRLIVRNASAQNRTTTTVLSAATLTR